MIFLPAVFTGTESVTEGAVAFGIKSLHYTSSIHCAETVCIGNEKRFIIVAMARITGVEPPEAGLFTRFVYWMTKRKIGRVILPLKITAHQPKLMNGMGAMEMAMGGVHSVGEGLKALASIQTAVMIGCPF